MPPDDPRPAPLSVLTVLTLVALFLGPILARQYGWWVG
jgi:hypothetical protein